MMTYEHLYIPDTEVQVDKKKGGNTEVQHRSDRRTHSQNLKTSLNHAWNTAKTHASSFPDNGTSLLIVEVNDIRRKRKPSEKRDKVFSGIGLQIKAVIDERHILVAMVNRQYGGFGSLLDAYGSEKPGSDKQTNLDVFDEIESFEPNIGSSKCSKLILDDDETTPKDVVLMVVPNMGDDEYAEAFPLIRKRVESLGGTVSSESLSSHTMPYLAVTLPSAEAVLSMCEDQAIYRIDNDGLASLDDFFPMGAEPPTLTPDLNVDLDSLPIVCVIDSGITDDGFVGPLICDRMYPDRECVNHHGTRVASRIAYGYVPDGKESEIITPLCRLIDCNVFHEGLRETEMISVVEEIVLRYHSVCKVYNLCINFPGNEGRVSNLSEKIDQLQSEFDVLFVISTGNYMEYIHSQTIEDVLKDDALRLRSPAQSVNALSVGAAAPVKRNGCISNVDQVVPYSLHGPGISGTVKPELLAYSANVDYFEGNGIYIFNSKTIALDDGKPINVAGTSFSAPIVSSYLARVWTVLPGLHIRTAKAVLINNCKPTSHQSKNPPSSHVGFGIARISGCLESEPGRVTFIREGVMENSGKVHLITIAVPDVLRGKSIRIYMTCISNPILDASRGLWYISSRLSVTVRKRDSDGLFTKEGNVKERVKPSSSDDPCQVKIYQINEVDTDELQFRVTSTTDYDDYRIPYSLVITIEEESKTVDLYNHVRNMNRYPTISEHVHSVLDNCVETKLE